MWISKRQEEHGEGLNHDPISIQQHPVRNQNIAGVKAPILTLPCLERLAKS
jgi:hypothetical protein